MVEEAVYILEKDGPERLRPLRGVELHLGIHHIGCLNFSPIDVLLL